MSKIELDKYYTPDELAKYCVEKTKEIIGDENIIEYLEPSAGSGVFLKYLDKPYLAYDIEPEGENIVQADYLTLDLEYKKGRCIIGNPPFGGGNKKDNNLFIDFLNKSIELGDYIAFILPIRQLNNPMMFYKFDLLYSEDLKMQEYTDRKLRCCFNIYGKPKNGLNKVKPNFDLKDVTIEEHHRTRNPLLNNNYDYRMCSFGSSLGKKCEADTYCKEYCFTIKDDFKKEVIRLLESTDFKKVFPSVSTPYVAKWQIYKYIKEQIPEIK